ncbi:MAG TPA: YkgJ family cysteine cluster protein [Azoarcus taiwanensis]|uniref:YkgJ family cysteine cluster protein n=1 Tax=Azoarcus taiwanensis TaxID=666964 RepID=UPI001FE4AA20|nr:YkgJ family cysteine cluster protein [Azoarcus taiwanensis]HRQ56263.1 YkgJ family cysteine cluster protein [Azoarcus taiwanensis]
MPPALTATVSSTDCRPGCGACCIAPSISSALPGMPEGKPAGVACPQLTADWRCAIFGKPERPACCSGLQPSPQMCGETREHALQWIGELEIATAPCRPSHPTRHPT